MITRNTCIAEHREVRVGGGGGGPQGGGGGGGGGGEPIRGGRTGDK